MTVQELNTDGVIVVVRPGTDFSTVDSIEDLVLKRGDEIMRPVKKSIEPTVVHNSLGAQKSSAIGQFQFSLDAFSILRGPVTIVCIGASANYEWTLTALDLANLR